MNYRQHNLAIFQRQPVDQVLFQPRIEPWFDWHRIFNSTPEKYKFEHVSELFDALDCSMRYVHYYTGMPDPVVQHYNSNVRIERQEKDGRAHVCYHTPFGDLTETQHFTIDHTWRTVSFAVKNRDDLRALKWLYENINFSFDPHAFLQGSDYVGDRGEPQFWVPKSPYQALAQIWMKLDNLIFALIDCPDEVEAAMQAIDKAYDPLYEGICDAGLVNIVNSGENIHEQLLSPSYFKRFLLPFWEKRVDQLRNAGIYSHVHIDGYFKHLLPLLKEIPHDGLEALTPEPQGDVTLEEIKEYIGDKILLDGIPAVLFMETYPREQLIETTEQIIELFHPNLVLGISDELPQGAGLESMERVEMIAKYCKQLEI
jgi:hypothetical protein